MVYKKYRRVSQQYEAAGLWGFHDRAKEKAFTTWFAKQRHRYELLLTGFIVFLVIPNEVLRLEGQIFDASQLITGSITVSSLAECIRNFASLVILYCRTPIIAWRKALVRHLFSWLSNALGFGLALFSRWPEYGYIREGHVVSLLFTHFGSTLLEALSSAEAQPCKLLLDVPHVIVLVSSLVFQVRLQTHVFLYGALSLLICLTAYWCGGTQDSLQRGLFEVCVAGWLFSCVVMYLLEKWQRRRFLHHWYSVGLGGPTKILCPEKAMSTAFSTFCNKLKPSCPGNGSICSVKSGEEEETSVDGSRTVGIVGSAHTGGDCSKEEGMPEGGEELEVRCASLQPSRPPSRPWTVDVLDLVQPTLAGAPPADPLAYSSALLHQQLLITVCSPERSLSTDQLLHHLQQRILTARGTDASFLAEACVPEGGVQVIFQVFGHSTWLPIPVEACEDGYWQSVLEHRVRSTLNLQELPRWLSITHLDVFCGVGPSTSLTLRYLNNLGWTCDQQGDRAVPSVPCAQVQLPSIQLVWPPCVPLGHGSAAVHIILSFNHCVGPEQSWTLIGTRGSEIVIRRKFDQTHGSAMRCSLIRSGEPGVVNLMVLGKTAVSGAYTLLMLPTGTVRELRRHWERMLQCEVESLRDCARQVVAEQIEMQSQDDPLETSDEDNVRLADFLVHSAGKQVAQATYYQLLQDLGFLMQAGPATQNLGEPSSIRRHAAVVKAAQLQGEVYPKLLKMTTGYLHHHGLWRTFNSLLTLWRQKGAQILYQGQPLDAFALDSPEIMVLLRRLCTLMQHEGRLPHLSMSELMAPGEISDESDLESRTASEDLDLDLGASSCCSSDAESSATKGREVSMPAGRTAQQAQTETCCKPSTSQRGGSSVAVREKVGCFGGVSLVDCEAETNFQVAWRKWCGLCYLVWGRQSSLTHGECRFWWHLSMSHGWGDVLVMGLISSSHAAKTLPVLSSGTALQCVRAAIIPVIDLIIIVLYSSRRGHCLRNREVLVVVFRLMHMLVFQSSGLYLDVPELVCQEQQCVPKLASIIWAVGLPAYGLPLQLPVQVVMVVFESYAVICGVGLCVWRCWQGLSSVPSLPLVLIRSVCASCIPLVSLLLCRWLEQNIRQACARVATKFCCKTASSCSSKQM